MKRITIFGAAITVIGLAACGSAARPTVAPTGTPTPTPTTASTPTSTPIAAATPTPGATPTPDLTPPSGPPVLSALCAPNGTELAWQISFGSAETNYNVDLSFNAGATFPVEETSATQPFTFDTSNAPDHQLVRARWDSYPSMVSDGTNANSNFCNPVMTVLTCDPTNPDGGDMVSWTGAGDFTMLQLTPPKGPAVNTTGLTASGDYGLPLTSTGTWGYSFISGYRTANEIQSRGTFVFPACAAH